MSSLRHRVIRAKAALSRAPDYVRARNSCSGRQETLDLEAGAGGLQRISHRAKPYAVIGLRLNFIL
jgi:hypothetical protein